MKVERVSYDVITPSAARAIFEAIFWKPAIRWRIRTVEVLNPIQWTSVRRNEVGSVMAGKEGLFVEDHRQQRAGLFLRDVAYRLHAEMDFIPMAKRRTSGRHTPEALVDPLERGLLSRDENPAKYHAMFERRVAKGQCFNQPYFGCREFSLGSFRLVDPSGAEPPPIQESRDLGFMLYDLDFEAEGAPAPAFFRAALDRGVMHVPSWDSDEVRR
jgi:CRISPR-associated protein Cas5d